MKSPHSAQPDELQSFLLSRQQQPAEGDVNWTSRRQEWVNAVEQLYHAITEDLLADSVSTGLVGVSYNEKEITEEFLGTYQVRELLLNIGGETVRFSPKGRNIIGASGRVDLIGELDSMTLILEPVGQWRLVVSRLPRRVVPLDRDALAQAFRTVMR